WGAGGFELVAASPRGLEFPAERRAELVSLARRRGVALLGATDSHGWGRAGCVWNIVSVPGWRGLDPDGLERAVLARLREGFGSVRVLERSRVEPARGLRLWLDPLRGLWLMARGWTLVQCLCALAWIWLAPLALSLLRL